MQLPFDPARVRVATPDHIASAARAVADCALQIANFRVGACANLASSRPMTDVDGNVLASSVFGWPDFDGCWWRDKSLAFRSPIPQISRIESEPVWANAGGVYRVDGQVCISPSIDLSMMDGEQVVRAAIIVPVHLPFSQVGVVTFSCANDVRTDLSAELEEHGTTLQMMSILFIGGYARVMNRDRGIPEEVALTKREAQCLRWAAIGKTDSEIAELISRTHGTVRYHLNRSSEKLGAVTRTQAVFKAGRLGYLSKS